MKKEIKEIESFVKKEVDELTWVHTQSVRLIAKKLAKSEKADIDIVEIAALLHDVAKDKSTLFGHAKEGARICRKYLKKMNYPSDFISKVVHCVESHSTPWSKRGPMPLTIEAKVIFDADMNQQLGSLGIVKHILKHKEKQFNELLKHAEKDLVNAYKLQITKSGKKLAKKRVKFVKDFFEIL